MRRVILFTLLLLFCITSQGQDTSGYKQAIVYYNYKTFGGFQRIMHASDGRIVRQGTQISISLIRGEWYIYGYMGEKEDTVMVTEKEALKVDKMIRKIHWEAFHPETEERLLKSDCDDCVQWSVYACTFRGDCHQESDGVMNRYIEPIKVAKNYDAAMRRIHKINRYLLRFLSF